MADQVDPSTPEEPAERGFELHEALAFLWRRWKFIGAVTAVVFLVGVVHLWQQTPLYTATARLLLAQPQGDKLAVGGVTLHDYTLDDGMVEGEMEVIRSDVFLRRVVEREHLLPASASVDHRPETRTISSLSPFSLVFASLRSLAHGVLGSEKKRPESGARVPAGSNPISPAERRAIGTLEGGLRVTRVTREGFVIAVSMTSPDPERAAQLANAIANTYLVDKLDNRLEAAKRASAWLSDQLLELKQQLHDSEEAIVKFRTKHGLVGTGGVTLTQQQLSQLNTSLIAAQADLAQKRAQVALLDSGGAKGDNRAITPGLSNAGELQSLRATKSNLSAEEAKLLTRYDPSHPLVVNIRAQIRDIDRSIAGEKARLASDLRSDYQLAKAKVTSLKHSLNEATGQTNLDDVTAVKLHELERTAVVDKILFEDFLKEAGITRAQSTFKSEDARVISWAVPPGAPSYPNNVQFMEVTLFLGLLLGVGGAFAKEILSNGFTIPKQVEDFLGVPLMTSVSRLSSRELTIDSTLVPIHKLPVLKPLSRFSEAMRALCSGIRMADVDHPPKVIEVSSAAPREGKTTIALSLAASAAADGLNVLFIDADLRHPTATRVFGLQDEPGLIDVLLGDARVEEVIRRYEEGGFSGLGVGAGTSNPTGPLGSERMRKLVAGLRDAYDFIIIDTPPTGPVIDPVVVSYVCDKAVLIVKWGVTARQLVKDSLDRLSGSRKVAGIVFNQVNEDQAKKYGKYAYASYYGSRYYTKYYNN